MVDNSKNSPVIYKCYVALLWLITPFIYILLFIRKLQGKEHKKRSQERFGLTYHSVKEQNIIWCHAASVGEYNALKILLEKWAETYPNLKFLVTTITTTSAQIAQKDIEKGAPWLHQFVPVEHPIFIKRFLAFWQPKLFITLESEIWPYTIRELSKQNTPCLLLNGRMSKTSFRNWTKIKKTAQWVFSHFDLICVQNKSYETAIKKLTSDHSKITVTGNIKAEAKPLIINKGLVKAISPSLANRKIISLISSHTGEEILFLNIYKELKSLFPQILFIICPRHAVRGKEIKDLADSLNLTSCLRSETTNPTDDCDIFIWDSMGELGTVYTLLNFAFIGGSYIPHGGQNPIEALNCDCAPIHGEYIHNFKDIYNQLDEEEGALLCKNEDIKKIMLSLLNHEISDDSIKKIVNNGKKVILNCKGALNSTSAASELYLKQINKGEI